MESDLNFTKDANGNSKYASFRDGSNIITLMPYLVESGRKFGNRKDLMQGMLKKYNRNTNDRNLLVGNGFSLPGNPIFSFNGEQTLVYDLELPELSFVKELVNGLNPKTKLNSDYSLQINKDIYHRIKESEGTHTLPKNLVIELMNDPYSNVAKREELLEKFCQDDSKLANKNINFVMGHKPRRNIENTFGFQPGYFEGMRFVCVYSANIGSDAHSTRFNYPNCRLFGVGVGDAKGISDTSARNIEYKSS